MSSAATSPSKVPTRLRSLIDWLSSLDPGDRTATIAKLTPSERLALEDFLSDWRNFARPNQLPPSTPWRIWFLCTGRKFGKTRTANEWAHGKAEAEPGSAGFFAARTIGDASSTLFHHPKSGLLTTQKRTNPCEITQPKGGGRFIVRWKNGAFADIHTSEEPDRARGGQYSWGVADEIATWKRVVDFEGNTTWDNLQFALTGGDHPQMVAASTPRRGSKVVRELLERGAVRGSGVVVTRGSMLDNRENLPASAIEGLLDKYQGTHLWRQEGEGQLLPDVEGALVTSEMISEHRVERAPELARIAVGVDPSGGRAEQGIVVAGRGVDGHAYILEDATCLLRPEGWGRRAIEAYGRHRADRIVAERNFGGEMVESTLRMVDPQVPLTLVQASRGKHVRFEPVGALYEQGRVHHVGSFDALEDEVCCFTPEGYEGDASPNRADALVWALTELMLGKPEGLSPDALYGEGGLLVAS